MTLIHQDSDTTSRENTMSKELKYLGTGNPSDPINTIAGDILAVQALNGHIPTDEEIADELAAAGLERSPENIARVREIVGEAS